MNVVVVANQKGGVGKTTLAVQLGASLSCRHRVLVVDADRQGSAGWWADRARGVLPFDLATSQSVTLLGRLRDLEHEYEYVLVDTPGGADAGQLMETVMDAADYAMIPLTPEPLALPSTMRTIAQLVEPRGLRYGIVLNRIDMCVPSQLRTWCELVDTEYGMPRFETPVRQYRAEADAPALGDLVTNLPDNRRTRGTISDITRLGLELDRVLSPELIGSW